MNLSLTKDELTYSARVRRFAEEHIAPIAEKIETQGYNPRPVLGQMGKQKLLGALFPKHDGGLGLGWTYETITAEESQRSVHQQKWQG